MAATCGIMLRMTTRNENCETKKIRAVVSLGSNIEPRREYLERAVAALAAMPSTRLVAQSSVIETQGVGVPDEFADMKFLNQVAVFETALAPLEFSRGMHAIEDSLGRVRTVRNGPRTIDIDLIDFGGIRMDAPELTLPHPRFHTRDFVLIPMRELGIVLPPPENAAAQSPRTHDI